ncbi:glycosyltransferase family 2 protein [Reichenbachiella ulvae]|uniref:Glycosyltransferase family 2 protein n=1 Tax=Reichenbachiella ulvae TaxID=2980104 RepID=A0ABT3CU64_9BACT|nr:glycosyltransferase family A protein [Reichenbachiella ulvae]MCV9387245.1 glycosyltransferase family 2 protein [Reichenbachiella ulvae]
MNKPRITILMAVYNAAKTISDCIESILNQTYQDFQVLIVNDCSTDNTVEIIERFGSNKIEVLHFDEKGFIKALNTGLDKCRTEYICRMDADDIMFKTKLEEQICYMDSHPEIAASGTYIEVFGKYSKIWKRFSPNDEQCRRNIFWFSTIQNPSSIIRNSVIKEHNIRYKREYAFIDGDKDYALAEDYKFWYDLSRVGKLSNLPKVLLKYRIHPSQASTRKKRIQDIVANKIRREALMDFLRDQGLEFQSINWSTDKSSVFEKVKQIKVAKIDQWHLAMTKYMLIQSTKEIGFFEFLKLVFSSNFIFDRNSPELCVKMIKSKFGNERSML